MVNKCPNCGWEFGEYDFFCARCGQKINQLTQEENEDSNSEKLNNSMNIFLQNAGKKQEYSNLNRKSIFNNHLVSYSIFILGLCIAFALSLNIYISRQQESKLKLQYKNIISKPQLIPELKEPQNYEELKYNIEKVEQFLVLYLKYSKDEAEKKEKIFSNYLDELNKLPHISTETMSDDGIKQCSAIQSTRQTIICEKRIKNLYKNTAIQTYSDRNIVYLYPDMKFIEKKYAKYLTKPMRNYLKLKSKYSTPTSVGLNLKISPKKLGDKIYDWEKCANHTTNSYIKENAENIIYNNFRKFIFTPAIYATTTHEMKKEFKDAYIGYIRKYKNSNLTPVIMSYLDKQKGYSEENFKNDYPYKIFEKTFEESVEESSLQDVFSQLRNSAFKQTHKTTDFKYVYNTVTNKWSPYAKNTQLTTVEYIISEIDNNGTISIYNNALSLFQELNIPKYTKLILINSELYLFNKDRLSISKISFTPNEFKINLMGNSDITSIFPGVNVVNIDNYTNYNIYLEKDNAKESFIIISKYTQGWQNYFIEPVKGRITNTILPNMFIVDSLKDVEIAFKTSESNNSQTSEFAPTYRFTIHTLGQKPSAQETENNIVQYDEATNEQNSNQIYSPIFKPKIGGNDNKLFEDKPDEDLLNAPPPQFVPAEE